MAGFLNLMRRALVSARPRSPSLPRHLSSSSFPIIESTRKIEEETLSGYRPFYYYPARIGEVLNSQYQLITKLGYGAYSTVWLCRDLYQHRYVTIKVYVRSSAVGIQARREMEAYRHLQQLKSNHVGRSYVRSILDQFEIEGPEGSHHCLVHETLSMKLSYLQEYILGGRLNTAMLRPFCFYLLSALDFLHSEAGIIHAGKTSSQNMVLQRLIELLADIKASNILLSNEEESVFAEMEKMEFEHPSARKIIDERRIIYESRAMPRPKEWGLPILCDFGEARFMERTYNDDIQPEIYRAPEVILHMYWDHKVDIWNFGVMLWTLFEGKHLFDSRDSEDHLDNTQQLSQMVAYLGKPPRKLLQREGDSALFFEEDGTLKDFEIPDISLETEEDYLEGEEKKLFLDFIRSMLRWLPEERKTAKELLDDPWMHFKR